jgi:hypothetical protein
VDSGAVQTVSGSTAAVGGSVDPGGVPTDAYVEYGTGTGYGSQTPAVAVGAGFGASPLTFTLTGLTANAPYHYRLVASNGPVTGEDRAVTFADADADGFFANVDCNDADAAVNPSAGEIVGNSLDENCDGTAAPFPPLGAKVGGSFRFSKHARTAIVRLFVGPVASGTTVVLTCRSPRKAAGKARCPFKTKTIAVRAASPKLQLAGYFKKRKLALKTTIEIRATKPATIGLVARLTLRNKKAPSRHVLCLPPGATRPAAC